MRAAVSLLIATVMNVHADYPYGCTRRKTVGGVWKNLGQGSASGKGLPSAARTLLGEQKMVTRREVMPREAGDASGADVPSVVFEVDEVNEDVPSFGVYGTQDQTGESYAACSRSELGQTPDEPGDTSQVGEGDGCCQHICCQSTYKACGRDDGEKRSLGRRCPSCCRRCGKRVAGEPILSCVSSSARRGRRIECDLPVRR